MGVYGNFLTAFPELHRSIKVWTKVDHSDERTIRAIFLDDKADGIRRKKFTSGNSALDMYDDAELYVSKKWSDSITVGDFLEHPEKKYMMRVVHEKEFNFAAGYTLFGIERVGGSTPDQTAPLEVKEAYFAN